MIIKKGSGEMSKRLIALTVLVVMFSILIAGCSPNRGNEIVAIIHGREITRNEFQKYLSLNITLYNNVEEFTEAEESRYLEFFINEEVFYTEALNRGIEATEEEIQEEYDDYREFVVETYFGNSNAEFNRRLQRLNLTESDLREVVVKNLLIGALIEEIQADVEPVTDEEIHEFYDENLEEIFTNQEMRKVRHILVSSEETANSILARLERGEDFAELAKEYSEDEYSAVEGGEMGFAEDGDFVEPFNEVAFSLPVGELSEVVQTQFGYHILEVMEIRPPGVTPLDEELTDQIRNYLQQTKEDQAILDILDELKKGNVENKLAA